MEKEKEENIWSVEEKKNREGKGGNIWRTKIFGRQRRRKTEKVRRQRYLDKENTWSLHEKKNGERK